jgi:hypothetical protein
MDLRTATAKSKVVKTAITTTAELALRIVVIQTRSHHADWVWVPDFKLVMPLEVRGEHASSIAAMQVTRSSMALAFSKLVQQATKSHVISITELATKLVTQTEPVMASVSSLLA